MEMVHVLESIENLVASRFPSAHWDLVGKLFEMGEQSYSEAAAASSPK